MMENVFMIVCSHKKSNIISEEEIYHFVIAGSALGNTGNEGCYRDDELDDNI